MTDWKPIESAPKNQRLIIYGNLYDTDIDESAMAWLDRIDDKWYYVPNGGIVLWKPTHWMPLPNKPKE